MSNSGELNPTTAQQLIDMLKSGLHHPRYGKNESSRVYEKTIRNYGIYEPSTEYEKTRRRVRQNTQELSNYFNSELNKIKKNISNKKPELIDEITDVIENIADYKRSLISDMDRLRMIDGYEQWRHDEAKSLNDLVQRRLHYLQNPRDCKNARQLICRINKGCGLGCQLHDVTFCHIVAYATERTLILKSKGWTYHKAGWEDVFHPVSETCRNIEPIRRVEKWPGQHYAQVLALPTCDKLIEERPPYLPLAIPADLAPRLIRLHGDPIVWWIGQFLKYLLRPTDATQKILETRMGKVGFKKPIVGVHIRRTDKGKEAPFHSIEEYMTYVEDYFLELEMNGTNIKRRVFLASDEAFVIDEAKKKYPSYEIICDKDVARMAAVSSRYTDSSLYGIISDIHMLSLCDYLVCTFSSQICRVAYEIMQTIYPDAFYRFKSLDDIYFYTGQNAHYFEAVLSHHPRHPDEIYMKTGDQIGIAGNHWNGYLMGKNTRTNQTGLFPSFKVNDKVRTFGPPNYANSK